MGGVALVWSPQHHETSRRRGQPQVLFCGRGGCRVCKSSLVLFPPAFLSQPAPQLVFLLSATLLEASREVAGLS